MLGIILITLIAIIVIIILIASKMPDNFRYTRALLINAPAKKYSRISIIYINSIYGTPGQKLTQAQRALSQARRRVLERL